MSPCPPSTPLWSCSRSSASCGAPQCVKAPRSSTPAQTSTTTWFAAAAGGSRISTPSLTWPGCGGPPGAAGLTPTTPSWCSAGSARTALRSTRPARIVRRTLPPPGTLLQPRRQLQGIRVERCLGELEALRQLGEDRVGDLCAADPGRLVLDAARGPGVPLDLQRLVNRHQCPPQPLCVLGDDHA